MSTRIILYTGKGGVGKTSVAAATALSCAAAGKRTLVLSTDPAHSLADSLQCEIGSDPTPVDLDPGAATDPAAATVLLHALQIDAQAEMARHWGGVQGWLGELLTERGVDRISADELTVPPGMDELFSLLRLQEQHESGDWDVIIVDCAPTGETLRLLSFPDVAQWWLDKIFPIERTLLAAAAPIARTMLDIPLPDRAVFADVERLSRNLIKMHATLRDIEHTTIRLVMNPDRMVIGEAMRTFTYLNLYGYLTDAVIVNRVFPDGVGDYFERWRGLQEEQLQLVREGFAPVPVLTAPYFDSEVIGVRMLEQLGEVLFSGASSSSGTPVAPEAIMHSVITQQLELDDERAQLRLTIPFARKEQIGLRQVGAELVVSAAGQRRTIMLPPALAAYQPQSARYEDGVLEVSFTRGD
jgi:arsenite/tail-anchored protein-transporting ATPase